MHRLRTTPLRPRGARSRPIVAAGLALLLASVTVAPAGAGDLEDQRDRVREEQAEVTSSIDVLRATDAELQETLSVLEADVSASASALADAELVATRARRSLADARRAQQAAERRVVLVREAVQQLAVDVFVNPPAGGLVETIQSDDVSEVALKQTYIDVRARRDLDVLDALTAAEDDLVARRAAAEEHAAVAEEAVGTVDARLREVRTARNRQAAVVDDVQERIDARLSEAAALERLDSELSAEIRAEQEALARRLAEQDEARRRAERLAARTSPTTPPVDPPDVEPPPPAQVSLRTVRSITVNESIADEVEALLAAAEADGIALNGGGYRDPEDQIRLRRAHCGTSYYAIYEMPPSQCTPPTARPGRSMHERGLAIDFTYQGRIISSRSSPAFRWLSAHAATYGLYNLPSEPWHWSTNGN